MGHNASNLHKEQAKIEKLQSQVKCKENKNEGCWRVFYVVFVMAKFRIVLGEKKREKEAA